jgi:hypothetical protein
LISKDTGAFTTKQKEFHEKKKVKAIEQIHKLKQKAAVYEEKQSEAPKSVYSAGAR